MWKSDKKIRDTDKIAKKSTGKQWKSTLKIGNFQSQFTGGKRGGVQNNINGGGSPTLLLSKSGIDFS